MNKSSVLEALEATPVCILIECLCQRLVERMYCCYADKFRSWSLAYELVQVVKANLINTGFVPQAPTEAEAAEWSVIPNRGLPEMPVCLLMDHICGRLAEGAYSGDTDQFYTWSGAYKLVEAVETNLINTGAFPHPPDGAEEAQFRPLIPQGIPKDYVPFRCTSANPVVEARLRADREELARRCQPFDKGSWLTPQPAICR
jgi:hypothetical protein